MDGNVYKGKIFNFNRLYLKYFSDGKSQTYVGLDSLNI
jgi:hypothetical protein